MFKSESEWIRIHNVGGTSNMARKNGTKQALLFSIVSLLLCTSMLVGTTYAWFTDSVTSANNKIVSGTWTWRWSI